MDWEALLPYCLGDQGRKIRAILDNGGNVAAACRQLGVSERKFRESIRQLKRRASQQISAGNIPALGIRHQSPVPLSGLSVYNKETPDSPAHWAKFTVSDAMRAEFLREMAEAFADDLPRLKPIPAPKHSAPDLLNLVTLTDTHVGMGAWAKESGHHWDLETAERTLVSAAIEMMRAAPKADTCFIAELGDWNHYDGHVARTPIHQHQLDAAGRPSQMVDASVRILRRIVDEALKRHRKVVLLVAQGNHDKQSYKWLRACMLAAYEREKRLHIITEESIYYCYRHGQQMLGFSHGHGAKADRLPQVFAARYPREWGATDHREIHCGHLHHKHVKDHDGATVYQHDTIAPNDSHGSDLGFTAKRKAEVLTYHAKYGRICSHVVTAQMLGEAA